MASGDGLMDRRGVGVRARRVEAIGILARIEQQRDHFGVAALRGQRERPVTVKGTRPGQHPLYIVEAAQAVPWTKPQDLPFTPGKPLPKLGGLFKDGFHIAVADGSVQFIPSRFNEKVFEALITPAGGEAVGFDELRQVKDKK